MSTKRHQSKDDIDQAYSTRDPWGYFSNEHDLSRKRILIDALSNYRINRALDVGCGNGFITESISAAQIVAIDISQPAIDEARTRSRSPTIHYQQGSLFDLPALGLGSFDAIIVTGVLYEQYIGNSLPLVYQLLDDLLLPNGLLVSVHIESWYSARFPYPLIKSMRYRYRNYMHLLEVYRK